MPLFDSPAIALRTRRLGETDKLVTFFTLRYGKVKAVAKGAYKTKSRYGGRLEPFTYGNLIVFGKEKAGIFRLNSFDVVDPYLPLRRDFASVNRAFVAMELVEQTMEDWDPNRKVFAELLELLKTIAYAERDRGVLPLRLFESRYLALTGFGPRLDRCVHCGKPPTGETGFNAARGGVVCGVCLSGDPFADRVSLGAIRLMEKGTTADPSALVRLSASAQVTGELGIIINGMVERHLRRRLRSERFLALG